MYYKFEKLFKAMKTETELTKEYEESYPIPTKGTKIMA